MTMSRKILQTTLIVALLAIPLVQVAAVDWWPIVPCGLQQQPSGATLQDKDANGNPTGPHNYKQDCNQCLLILMFKNIIDMVLYGIVPVLGTFFFLLGGFYIFLGSAKPSLIAKGKDIFWNTAIGIAIVLGSWLITNTILKSLAPGSRTDNWYTIECRTDTLLNLVNTTVPISPTPTVSGAPSGTATVTPTTSPSTCSDKAQLAASNNEPFPIPSPGAHELVQLIGCIRSNLSGQDLGSQFTYDQSYELCNYTRGQATCTSSCSHTTNSCHYGGRSGNQGALAVDFGNQAIGDSIIQAAIGCGVPSAKARCENAAGVRVACVGAGATHVHISAASCNAN